MSLPPGCTYNTGHIDCHSIAPLVVRNVCIPPCFSFLNTIRSIVASWILVLFTFSVFKVSSTLLTLVIGLQLSTYRNCLTWVQRGGQGGSLLTLHKLTICSKKSSFETVLIHQNHPIQPAIMRVCLWHFFRQCKKKRLEPLHYSNTESTSEKWTCSSIFLWNFLLVCPLKVIKIAFINCRPDKLDMPIGFSNILP